LTETEDGAILVRAGDASFTADAVLASVGRRPNIAGLGLETLGVPLDDRGMPDVDPHTLRIGDLPVFLVGDANGNRALLHEAADEGHIAGRNAVADASLTHCRRTPLGIVFSSPQVARVGKGFSEIEEHRRAVGTADFSKQARARTAETAAGLMHIYADKETGALLGAEMCVPAGEHMAHLLALALERELTVADLLAMPFYHPVLEEGLRGALRELARKVPGKGGSDLSDCPATGHSALD
jgi:dihydrolipoamide dehydrogenase